MHAGPRLSLTPLAGCAPCPLCHCGCRDKWLQEHKLTAAKAAREANQHLLGLEKCVTLCQAVQGGGGHACVQA